MSGPTLGPLIPAMRVPVWVGNGMPLMITDAPASAKALAMASPIPELAPVAMARCFAEHEPVRVLSPPWRDGAGTEHLHGRGHPSKGRASGQPSR